MHFSVDLFLPIDSSHRRLLSDCLRLFVFVLFLFFFLRTRSLLGQREKHGNISGYEFGENLDYLLFWTLELYSDHFQSQKVEERGILKKIGTLGILENYEITEDRILERNNNYIYDEYNVIFYFKFSSREANFSTYSDSNFKILEIVRKKSGS